MEINPEVKKRLHKVIETQRIAVLGTSMDDEPYSCLVGFAFTEDIKDICFATMRNRLKYRNIMANPRVTLMIDNRDKMDSDFNETTSITVVGSAEDLRNSESDIFARLLLKRHPQLSAFLSSPDCAIIRVKVDKIYIVSEFESVIKIDD